MVCYDRTIFGRDTTIWKYGIWGCKKMGHKCSWKYLYIQLTELCDSLHICNNIKAIINHKLWHHLHCLPSLVDFFHGTCQMHYGIAFSAKDNNKSIFKFGQNKVTNLSKQLWRTASLLICMKLSFSQLCSTVQRSLSFTSLKITHSFGKQMTSGCFVTAKRCRSKRPFSPDRDSFMHFSHVAHKEGARENIKDRQSWEWFLTLIRILVALVICRKINLCGLEVSDSPLTS